MHGRRDLRELMTNQTSRDWTNKKLITTILLVMINLNGLHVFRFLMLSNMIICMTE